MDDRSVDEDGSSGEYTVSTSGDEADVAELAVDGINLKMLKSLLKSYGSIKSFSLTKDVDPMKASAFLYDMRWTNIYIYISGWCQPYVKVFHVEYYDLRDANAAYVGLHGQVLFGMYLRVSGRDRSEDRTPRSQYAPEAQIHVSAPSDIPNDLPKNVIPFPTSAGTAVYPPDGPLQLGPPGQSSQTRERFLYTDPAQSRPRSVNASHDGYATLYSPSPTHVSSPHPDIPSPTVFYTSMPAGGSDTTTMPQAHQIRQPSSQFAFDAIGRPHVFPGNNFDGGYNAEYLHSPERASRVPDGNSVTWGGEMPYAQLPGSHQECYYCPSRGASGDCYTYQPRSPMYSPVEQSSLAPPLPSLPLPPPAPMFGTGYHYDNHHTLPVNYAMNMANSFEQSMIPRSRAATGETWFTPSMVTQGFHGVPFYSPPVQVPGSYGPYCPPLKPEPPLQIDSTLHTHMNDVIYRADPPSSSPSSSRLTGRATSPRSSANKTREPSSPPERNQLNLARIEDGQDTRTTVMIKNIPNKMSDKDLVTFIGKVCARKIDFLYLRMDFQNGISLVLVSNDC